VKVNNTVRSYHKWGLLAFVLELALNNNSFKTHLPLIRAKVYKAFLKEILKVQICH